MTVRKDLFSRALAAAPGRLHFAAHSHHLWPDVSFDAQSQAWLDANAHADRKWGLIFDEVVPRAQAHVARELGLRSGDSLTFSSNTHDFLIRLFSGIERKPVRILSTDGEFHSFRRQSQRWEEAGEALVHRVPLAPFDTFVQRFVDVAQAGQFDLIIVSQVFFRTGQLVEALEPLADLADPDGPWVVIDGYHGFMATPTDLSATQDRVFYLAGGYKYAMAGEGACFLHAPSGFCPRPVTTGWFAEFGNLEGPPGGVGYREDGGRFWGATFDVSALYRFNAVQGMLQAEGLTTPVIAGHTRGLADRFQAAVISDQAGPLVHAQILNPVVWSSTGHAPRARFLALRHADAGAWQGALLDHGIVTDVRDDVIRFGFSIYQDEGDIDRLIQVCRDHLR